MPLRQLSHVLTGKSAPSAAGAGASASRSLPPSCDRVRCASAHHDAESDVAGIRAKAVEDLVLRASKRQGEAKERRKRVRG